MSVPSVRRFTGALQGVAPWSSRRAWLGVLAVAVAAFGAYLPALNGGFVWDDESWTTNIEPLLRDKSGLWEIWRNPLALQQYYPLTGTTFWLDHQCWGWWTLPYHVENLLLHLAGAFLFWRLLERLKVPGAWLAGAVFALHPVMVESVAWITERKNVLSMMLFLGALLAYARFADYWSKDDRPRPRGWYAWALVLFLGALLSKVTVAAFPAVLLVLCWWKRGSIRWREDLMPLLPFFLISVAFGFGISWLEKHTVGAQGPDWDWSWPQRLLIAGRAFWFYLGKIIFPAGLSFVYPPWSPGPGSLLQWLMAAGVVAAFIGLWLARNLIGRGPVAAACLFAGLAFPVLGFMNVYGMRFSVVADHWVYLPALPVIALMAAVLVLVSKRLGGAVFFRSAAAVVLAGLVVQSWKQSGQYRGMEQLWISTLARNPDCWLAHNNLGNLIGLRGDLDGAMVHFQKALELRPAYAEAHNNLGETLLHKGRVGDYKHELERAVAEFQKAVDLEPWNAAGHYNLGNALLQAGNVDQAILQFERALAIKEDYADAHNNLGVALMQKNRTGDAIAHYRRALQLQPKNAEALVNLGAALFEQGQADEALSLDEQALAIRPDHSGAHNNLGMVLLQKGRTDDAEEHFRRAIELSPANAEAQCNLAKCLVEKQKFDEAIGHYESALKVRPGYGDAHYGLGIALSRTGQIKEAARHYQLAEEIEPARADARINLGNALLQLGEAAGAVEQLEKAVALEPDDMLSHNSLGSALLQTGRAAEAVKQFEQALKLSPDNWVILNNLSWVLATSPEASVRDGARAVELAQLASKSGGGNPLVLRTLAAAYAEAGKFADAASTADAACHLALSQGNSALAESMQAAGRLYQSGVPFRDSH